MAAEREQKLKSQHSHCNHATQKASAADHITASEKHSPNFTKKHSTSGQQLPKNSVPVVEEEQSIENHKKLRRKVCIITYSFNVVIIIYVCFVLRWRSSNCTRPKNIKSCSK